jgi:hypothetical protein
MLLWRWISVRIEETGLVASALIASPSRYARATRSARVGAGAKRLHSIAKP